VGAVGAVGTDTTTPATWPSSPWARGITWLLGRNGGVYSLIAGSLGRRPGAAGGGGRPGARECADEADAHVCFPPGRRCPHWPRVPGCHLTEHSLPRPAVTVEKEMSNSEHRTPNAERFRKAIGMPWVVGTSICHRGHRGQRGGRRRHRSRRSRATGGEAQRLAVRRPPDNVGEPLDTASEAGTHS